MIFCRSAAQSHLAMLQILTAGIATIGLVLWAHQLPTIGGRVPMVFVALWFGSATMVALIFGMAKGNWPFREIVPSETSGEQLWRYKMRVAASSLLPLTLIPLFESRAVRNDPAIWLLDCAFVVSLCSVPYFTLVARTVLGGAVLSVGAFQALWICGASLCFRIMERAVQAAGGQIARGAAFEEFFRRPEYRYLFYCLSAVMMLGYCPVLLWLSHRRFLHQTAAVAAHDVLSPAPRVRRVLGS